MSVKAKKAVATNMLVASTIVAADPTAAQAVAAMNVHQQSVVGGLLGGFAADGEWVGTKAARLHAKPAIQGMKPPAPGDDAYEVAKKKEKTKKSDGQKLNSPEPKKGESPDRGDRGAVARTLDHYRRLDELTDDAVKAGKDWAAAARTGHGEAAAATTFESKRLEVSIAVAQLRGPIAALPKVASSHASSAATRLAAPSEGSESSLPGNVDAERTRARKPSMA